LNFRIKLIIKGEKNQQVNDFLSFQEVSRVQEQKGSKNFEQNGRHGIGKPDNFCARSEGIGILKGLFD